MTKKRSKDRIIYNILEACYGDGISKTQVVYAASLNFRTVVPYLDLLVQNELLEISNGPCKLYKTTPKGLKAIGYLKELDILIQ